MATDIKISELNEVSCNNPLNHIIINDRESAGDDGITKKITLENFFTTGIVKENAIAEGAITTSKLGSLSVDRTKIANNTITCNQILDGTICRNLLTPNIITNNELHNDCNYVVAGLHVTNNCLRVSDPVDGCLQVDSGRTQLGTIIYGWPTSQTAGYFLKTDGSGGLSWEAPSESTASSLVFTEIMPVGTIVPWSGAGSSVPNDKWLVCNGTTFSSDDYPELAAVLGDTYGAHSGTTYYLPNYQGRVPVGSGTTQDINNNSETFTIGSRGGEFTHQLTCTEMPTHNHDNGQFNSLVTINGTGTTRGVDNTPNEINVLCGGTIQQAGGNGFHNNIQPYIGTSYIIKAKKDDIQQFNPTLGKGLSAIDSSGQTATLELSSTEIGVKIDNNTLRFDGSNSIELNPALSASSIKFNDGTIQTVAPTISGVSEGLVGDGTGALHTLYEVEHGLGRTPTLTQFFWKCKSTANGKNYGYEVGTELYITSQSDSGLGHMTTAAGPTKIYYYNGWQKMIYAKTTGTYKNSNFQPANTTDNWELRYRVFV